MTETPASPEPEPPSRKRASLLRRFARRLMRIVGGDAADVAEEISAREERGEAIEDAQRDMILKAARFDQLKVYDVMRPRADIVAVEASATLGETARIFSESQHSRLPIYRETLDDPVGLVHVRDLMALLAPNEAGESRANFGDRVLTRIRRDLLFVPQSMKLSTLFVKMQTSRSHLALVIDEYGGTDGIISMEDLVEQIVGEIEDEHDDEATLIQARVGGIVEADGRAAVDALETSLGASLALPEHEDEFDTVAGLAMALAGRVPQRGEILRHPAGYDIEVIESDPRHVRRVRIAPVEAQAPGPASAVRAR